MIGKRAEQILNRAVRSAFDRKHEYFTLEHVLLSLLEETAILEIIQACNGNTLELKKELEDYLEKEVPRVERGEALEGDIPGMVEHPVATLSIQRLIQRALFHVQSAGKDEIEPEDLFVALFQSKDSFALHLLKKQGIERLDALNAISHGSSGKQNQSEGSQSELEAQAPRPLGRVSPIKSQGQDPLQQFTVNLNLLASQGKIDPLVGREREMERLVQVLVRRRKNNPLLVGEAGVGKTALAEGLALRIIEKKVPEVIESAEVYSLDVGSLLAGAKFRGDFEQRLKRVVKSLEARKESGKKPILFIDEIHTIIGAGAVSGGALDAANLIKPVLSRGEIQCIGSTTYGEYRSIFEKDHALARRFQKIEVPEPTQEETIAILLGLREKFESHHGIRFSQEAIRAAVELSAKHLTDRFLPDKAIDVIDEAGARARLQGRKDVALDIAEIEEIIAQMARIPARTVTSGQKTRLQNLERDLKLTIFGQDMAIDALVTAIRLARSGLRTGDRPVGSFLFCGPTGVGKTELTRQLAHALGVPLLRFDMSEYMEKHTVSRLIGAPPGYVGFEQSGQLTEAALKNPHSVILLDEVEKAHSDIWNILLQVMDHGTLTDQNGRKADFRNTILVMTSNIGSRDLERKPMGFGVPGTTSLVSKRAVEQAFSPEFRNRLDATVYFNSLDPVTIGQIVGKQILELEAQLLKRNVEIELDSDVREWLALKGFDLHLGARPMARLIQERIKRPLSEELLFGRLEHGGKVRVLLKDGEPSFEVESRRVLIPAPAE